MYKIIDKGKNKWLISPEYNYMFNKETGFFIRTGKTMQDDPEYSPFGPEIMDIEISTVCSNGCKFCYKSNTHKGENMSFETFKKMFDKFPDTLTQIAFGIGDIDANPDMWKIFDYCRDNDIVPNVTINGSRMTPELYDRLASTCGAVAVSLYDPDVCYDAVKELSDRGMNQVNIHCLVSTETYDKCLRVINDKKTDPRLEGLNAIVFLWLKPKGLRNTNTQLCTSKYQTLVNRAMDSGVAFGFDSCSASNFLKMIQYNPDYKQIEQSVEPCESTLFSYYINTKGLGFPCSFSEGTYKGIDAVNCEDFVKDIWHGTETQQFRASVTSNLDENKCRMCPIYDLCLKGD